MNNILKILSEENNFVILTHINPDGDAIGSSLAMYHALKKINKDVDIVINEAPKAFSYLNGYNDIKSDSNKKYNIGIILDCATLEKVNANQNLLNNIDKLVVIDHHISNAKYGDVNYVEEFPACAQIVYNIVKELGIEIDKNIGEAIYNGILTDTGGLAYSSVKSDTFLVAYELSKIINTSYVNKNALRTVTKSQFELKKICIEHLEFYKDSKIAYSYITEDDLNRVNGEQYDANILVNIGTEIEGVLVSIFVRFLDDVIRVSLRSNDTNIDVNKIANKFNGGGHVCAAGFRVDKDTDKDKLKKDIINEVEKVINEWNNSSK